MHARCCGLDDAVYRFAVNQQSAGNDPCWPCSSCARRHATTTLSTTTSSRRQQPPPDVPASPPPSSSQQQPAANGSGIVEFIHVARGGLRLCYRDTATPRRPQRRTASDGSARRGRRSTAKAQLQLASWYVIICASL